MLLAMLVAAAVSFAATPLVKTLACKVGAIDVPKDNRRMHKVPIPRMGGLAIFLAFLLSVLVFAEIDRQMQGILLGAIMIVILGVLDDIMALKALPKLFVQIAAAGVAVWHGCRIQFISNPNVFSEATYLNLGWLSIPGVIDLPVVYRNNVYYETHDFYGREDKAGTLFLDKNHPLRSTTQNLLIHGHNMRDGTMFGRLLQYETNLSYVKDHGIIHFDTIYEEQTYVVFAVMIASFNSSSSRYFDFYTHATFASETEFTNYVYAVRARSLYSIPVDVRADDALLTLSTCLDDDRLVILARRLRDGETEAGLRAQLGETDKR